MAVWGQDEILERLRGRDEAGPLSLPLCLLPGSEPWLSCGQWPHHHSPPSSCGPRGQLLPVTISGHRQQCESGLEHTEPCHLETVEQWAPLCWPTALRAPTSETILFPRLGRKEIMHSRGLGGTGLGAFSVESSFRQAAQCRI